MVSSSSNQLLQSVNISLLKQSQDMAATQASELFKGLSQNAPHPYSGQSIDIRL
ncbi:putative motility protein [Brevibacillus centrosporus]|uniref:putative motility protein n=1 Tax=Brevibacillus centrosporus TaxID=54910 RepID=UPI00399CB0EF